LNSTDAGLGGINVYDDDHDDDDVRGVDDSNSTAGGGGDAVVVEHGANVLAIDAATPRPNSETGSNDFKPPPANKPSFPPPPPPPAPRTVTSTLFQSVVNSNDHDHNDTDDKDDDDNVDANFSSNTLPSSQSSAPSTLPPSYPSKVPPPPQQQQQQQQLPPTTHQLSSSLVPPPSSSSQQPSSTLPPSISIKNNNIQDILNQKFSEKNIQKPIEQVQNPVVSLNNTAAVNKVTDDTKGGFHEVFIKLHFTERNNCKIFR